MSPAAESASGVRAAVRRRIVVQAAAFDLAAEFALLVAGDPAIGGVGAFVGLVRDSTDGAPVTGLTLEHYPGMTERGLAAIAEEAERRWPLIALTLLHRVGALAAAEPIVLVLTASPHRAAALDSCGYLIDQLKTRAAFWKREATPAGERWVVARADDDRAAARWSAG